ncbi:MAG: histidine--tRNA ligase [Chlamydiia bacterium]|nr:histidine--tRNA ligase [Chlamydiia bacterium]
MKAVSIAPGVFDLLPDATNELWRSSFLWHHLKRVLHQTAGDFCFEEIQTPIFERTELFIKSVGETSDIVTKEMYTFEDRGGRSMTLRPEGTAPVMRAFIDNQLVQQRAIHRLYYIGPMFRYERTQAGRYRQHHQFGAEVIGVKSAEQDAELIDMAYTLYSRLGIKNLSIQLNSLGSTTCRQYFREQLVNFLKKHYTSLSEDSQKRFETNPLRILDSKSPQDQEILKEAPSILESLNEESLKHLETVQHTLDILEIPYTLNPRLVRGLDYYNQTVFEVVATELGAQNSIGGGGRFDGLIHSLGGPDLPSVGFATGLERVLQTLLKQQVPLPQKPTPLLFFIPLGDAAKKITLCLAKTLREQNIAVEIDLSNRKLNKAMQYANQIGAHYTAVVGDDEVKDQAVTLKDMATGETRQAPLYHLGRILNIEAKSDTFINMWKEMTTPFTDNSEADYFIQSLTQNIAQTQQATQELQRAVNTINSYLNE